MVMGIIGIMLLGILLITGAMVAGYRDGMEDSRQEDK